MKRKLGVALLIMATALAGTPEALKQFQDLNQSLQNWAHTGLGSSFLVYAEGTAERALPDRYDYHQLAPVARHAVPPAPSYGLMASLPRAIAPIAPAAQEPGTCPVARRAAERVAIAPRAVEAQTIARVTRRVRVSNTARPDQLAREIERAAQRAARALGIKLDAQQFAEIIKGQEVTTKLKALRIRPAGEALKLRRLAPVRVARLEADELLPFAADFELSAPVPPAELARRNSDDENKPGATAEEQSKRKADAKARKGQKPGARGDQREYDVAPFVIMASTDGDAKGFDCNGKDNY